jgi:hypothetical protein
MLEQAKGVGINVLKTTGGVMAINIAGVPSMVRNAVGTNKILSYGADGLIYGLVADGVDYVSGSNTSLFTGDYWGFVDDVVFMTVVSAVCSETNLVTMAYNQIANVSPLDRDMNLNLVEGALISTGRALGDLIDSNPQFPDAIHKIRHVTRLIR